MTNQSIEGSPLKQIGDLLAFRWDTRLLEIGLDLRTGERGMRFQILLDDLLTAYESLRIEL
jgi:hypothetical protein